MNASMKALSTVVAIALLSSANAYGQDDSTDLNVGKIEQLIESSGSLELKSNGFGNTQAANLIKANGDLIQNDGDINQSVTLQGELNFDQANIGSRQAANYIGATGSADLASVNQSVSGATAVTLDQVGSHLSVQGVNVVESGATILPVDEFTGIAGKISEAVIDAAVGKIKDEAVDTVKELIPGT